jgi:flagellar biosynthetic protein FliR
MISLTSAQLDAWIAAFIYPLARILALIVSAPPFSNAAVPTRIKLAVGLALSLGIAPALPPIPPITPGSGAGLLILAQQMLIGVAMGFSIRIAVSAIDFAGEAIGLQMGLGFASFYDPDGGSQSPVVSQLLSLFGTLVLLAMDGHLMILAMLAQSFTLLPIGGTTIGSGTWLNLGHTGIIIFASGMMLALPVVAAMMVTNTAIAVLTRAAPQLNLFAIGFPITLAGGFIMIYLMLGYLATPLVALFEHAIQAMLGHFIVVR